MNSPLKEFLPFVFDSKSTKELVESLHYNLTRDPPAKALTSGQLKTLAERKFLEGLLEKLN